MALVLNGSNNTVAGLAVGGLPDGVVDDGTLATNAVTNVKVADDAIGVAELSTTGTAGSGNYLRGDNAWTAIPAATGTWSLVGSANTSVGTGNSFTFTGISASAKQILMVFKDISFDADKNYTVRIGPSGGVATSGYKSFSSYLTDNNQGTNTDDDNFLWHSTNAAVYTGCGYIHLINFTGNTWSAFGHLTPSNATGSSACFYHFNGYVDAGGTVDRIQILPQSSASMDDGEVTVYEVT